MARRKSNLSIIKGGKEKQPWENELRTTVSPKGTYVPEKSISNILVILTRHPDWEGTLAWDDFAQRKIWRKPAPIINGARGSRPLEGENYEDHHTDYIGCWMIRELDVKFSEKDLEKGVVLASRENRINAVQLYLKKCGELFKRNGSKGLLDSWLTSICNVAKSQTADLFGRLWLISAVARAFTPGCQADHVLILEGPQGCRKTSALRIIGGEWYQGSLSNINNPLEAAYQLQGKWIIDLSELDALGGARNSRIKAFFDSTQDSFRWKFSRHESTVQRACVFCSTTNKSTYLKDPTGGRRFWPVVVGTRIDTTSLRDVRDVLLGEAYCEWVSGSKWWLTDDEADVLELQRDRYIGDPWAEAVHDAVAGKLVTTVAEVMDSMMIDTIHRNLISQKRVVAILRREGFRQKRDRNKRWYEREEISE